MPRRSYDHIIETFDNNWLKPYFIKFIEMKRGKGEIVANSSLYNMKYINNHLLGENNETVIITKEMVWDILREKENIVGHVPDSITAILRQFLCYLSLYFPETYQLPDNALQSARKPFHSFVFTEEELNAIVEYADKEERKTYRYLQNHVFSPYPFIVRMLIGTGMRIGEVLSLQMKDIDLEKNIIQVLNGKAHIARFIPISNSLSEAMKIYMETVRNEATNDSPLFISPHSNSFYSYEAMRFYFPKMFKELGISTRNGEKPSIHSFRHTFCTRSLNRMLSSGLDFYTAVPILSAYLGHTNTIDTEKYIHLIGMKEIDFIDQEKSISSLIPEVEDYE